MKVVFRVVGFLILIAAVAGAVVLVQRNQETRKGATVISPEVVFQPGTINLAVGQSAYINLAIDTKLKKMDVFEFGLEFDKSKLRIEAINPLWYTEGGSNVYSEGVSFFKHLIGDDVDTPPDQVMLKVIDSTNGKVKLSAVSMRPVAKTASGVVQLFRMLVSVTGSGPATIKMAGVGTTNQAQLDGVMTTLDQSKAITINASEVITCSTDADCSAGQFCYQPPMPVCPPGRMCPQVMPQKICQSVVPTATPPTMCSYPAPRTGCTYVNGPNYNPATNCGKILSCPTVSPTLTLTPTPTTAITRYTCNTTTHTCSLAANGAYINLASCQSGCVVPSLTPTPTRLPSLTPTRTPTPTPTTAITRYTCNTTTHTCSLAANGAYINLASCQSGCVVPSLTPTPTPTTAITRYACNSITHTCSLAANGAYFNLASCQSGCVAPSLTPTPTRVPPTLTPTPTPTTAITRYTCNTTTHTCSLAANGPFVNQAACQTYCVAPSLTPTKVPTATPTLMPIANGVDSVLNYKMSFANVNPNSAKCLVDWPLRITVSANGQTKVYNGIIPQTRETVDNRLVFGGSLNLVGFTQTSGVSVFMKGPQHLQTKYGRDGQSDLYDRAVGELTLTDTTTPVYDFSQYPMLAGDVVSNTSTESQDGSVNGVDFAYVKSKSLIHETVAEGSYLRGDLDGNCQVNSNDVNILKISLQEKQEELY